MSHLAAAGEISDEGGMASTLLAKEVGYPGSSIAFAQLLSGMERSGLIRREVRGKRTYRITAVPGSATRLIAAGEHKAMSRAATAAGLDYDELARRLLVQVVRELAVARRELTPPAGPAPGTPGPGNGGRAGLDDGPLAHPADGPGATRPAPPATSAAAGTAAVGIAAVGTAAVSPAPVSTAGLGTAGLGTAGLGTAGAGTAGAGTLQAVPLDEAAGPGGGEPGQPPDALENVLADLQRELASAREVNTTVSAENARLREQLRAARRSLARLRGRATRRPVTEDLDADETGLLDHLLAPAGKPGDGDDRAAD